MSELFSITSQGRAYNVHALASLQRPDSQFLAGFRENFTTVVGLGRISPEAAKMVGFSDYQNFNNEDCQQRSGYILSDLGLKEIKVPTMRNFDKINDAIIDVVTR